MFDFSRKKSIYSTIYGNLVELRRPRLEAQDEWCTLRAMSEEHLVPWEPAWNNLSTSPRGFRKRLEYIDTCWNDRSAFHYFIYTPEKDELVGAVTLHNIRYGACMHAQIGYWIGIPYIRKGFMTEAVHLLLDHTFHGLALNRVSAACMPANKASISLLTKCGFVVEGLAREYLCINSLWQDHVIFSLLAKDYASRSHRDYDRKL